MKTFFSNSAHTRKWLENFFALYSDVTICAKGQVSSDTDFDKFFRLLCSLKIGDVFCLNYVSGDVTLQDCLMVDVDCLRPISYPLYFQLSKKNKFYKL